MTEAQVVERRQGLGVNQMQLRRPARLAGVMGLGYVGARHRQRGPCGVAHVGLWRLKILRGASFPTVLGARSGWSFEWWCLVGYVMDWLSLGVTSSSLSF